MNGLTVSQRLERATILSLAFLENVSGLIPDRARFANSGPKREEADKIRKSYVSIVEASVHPYLMSNPQGNSTSKLTDQDAGLFPPQLIRFLPEPQQKRLVRHFIESLIGSY